MDNWTCSANIKLLNEEMAEEVNAMEVFDLMEINCAMMEKDMITITYLEIKRVLDKKGVKTEEGYIWTTEGSQCASFELAATCLHTSYLSFLLQWQDFRKPNFTPKKRLKAPKTLKMSLKLLNICIFFTQSGKIYT